VQVEGYQFHIDPGPGTLVQGRFFDVNLRATTAVLVSSNEILACGDVNALISAMTLDGLDVQGVMIADENFFSGSEEEKFITERAKKLLERCLLLV